MGKDSVDVAFSPEYPYKIQAGLLTFIGTSGDEKTLYPFSSLLEFDASKRETAFMVHDYFTGPNLAASEIAPRQVRLQVKGFRGTPGNILVFGAADRQVPGIVIADSTGVDLSDLIIYHAGGMGIIGERSSDLLVDRVKVTPSGDRMISTSADATHFVNCSGKLSMIDCVFENQMDDATNIHGIYLKITDKLSPNSLEVRLMHPQQYGFDFLRAGMKIELVHANSLVTYGELTVQSVERLNSELNRVIFDSNLPQDVQINDIIDDTADKPNVLIQGCTIRDNRARGLLLGSRGPILVQGNTFHTAGSAILMEGDGRFWFEQAGVRSLTIRRNVFDNCNYGVWGKGVIAVGAGIEPSQQASSRYNRNIVIEDNLFRVFDHTPLFYGYSIDGLVFKDNRVEETHAYPDQRSVGPFFHITDSDHISIQQPTIIGK